MTDDIVGRIVRYEAGEFDAEETIRLFQDLIDTSMIWNLQGSYGRKAEYLINVGLCAEKKADTTVYIPDRDNEPWHGIL